MRAKFTQLPNSVALEYDNIHGVRIRREFFVSGRYVYEGGLTSRHQVCSRLLTRGETLLAEGDLLKQIRTEWKKFRSNQ